MSVRRKEGAGDRVDQDQTSPHLSLPAAFCRHMYLVDLAQLFRISKLGALTTTPYVP
jgi:hypothetical protein